jgi:hypothetical protein
VSSVLRLLGTEVTQRALVWLRQGRAALPAAAAHRVEDLRGTPTIAFCPSRFA